MSSNVTMAIDPGKSGGIAILFPVNRTLLSAMPETESELQEVIANYANVCAAEDVDLVSVLEKVGGFTGKGQPGSAMFTFGRGVGVIVGILMSYKIPFREVRPQDWQKKVGAGTTNGRTRAQWKRHLLDLARKRHPDVKGLTLKTCDALLMLDAEAAK